MNAIRRRAWRLQILCVWGAMAIGLGCAVTQVAGQQRDQIMGITSLVRAALDSNRDLVAAREGNVVAQEQVSEAWSNVMPSVDFNGSYTRNISPPVNFLPAQIFDPTAGPDDYIPVQFGADNAWSTTVAIEQPLFRPGVIVALGAASRVERLLQLLQLMREPSEVADVKFFTKPGHRIPCLVHAESEAI